MFRHAGNALVWIGLATFRVAGNSEAIREQRSWKLEAGCVAIMSEKAPQGSSLIVLGAQHFIAEGGRMPLVRIDLIAGKTPEYRLEVGQIVYQALLEIFGVPKDDRFQVITEHPKPGLQFASDYLGIHKTDDCIFFQITMNAGRTVEMKKRFYKAVTDALHERLRLRREDVVVNLVEVPKENWSYGNGEAQYVSPAP